MRLALSALIFSFLVWSCAAVAQTHGSAGASGSSSATSKGSVSAVPSRSFSVTSSARTSSTSSSAPDPTTTVTVPGGKGYVPGPIAGESREHFRNRNFGQDFSRNRHHRYPFAGYPFGYGYGYGVDYSGWYADQTQAQNQQYMTQNERLEQSYQDDVKRQHELDRQIADQRAADEATPRSAPAATTATPTERELPPTVLIYKDQHQVEVRNYAIAGNTIYEFNPHWTRKIALAELDIPATIAANKDRGVEFNVPNVSPVKVQQPQQ